MKTDPRVKMLNLIRVSIKMNNNAHSRNRSVFFLAILCSALVRARRENSRSEAYRPTFARYATFYARFANEP